MDVSVPYLCFRVLGPLNSGQHALCFRAEAMLQALAVEATEGKKFALESKEGAGPGTDAAAWKQLFESAR